jgi:hypothetical protein
MAQFAVGQSITTATPTIIVDAGLAIGGHRFQLVVVDSSGLRSAPDVKDVSVQRLVVVPPVVGPVTGPVINPVGPVATPVLSPSVTPSITTLTTPRKPTA